MAEREVDFDGQIYVCAADHDEVRVGRRDGDGVQWFPGSVPASALPHGLDDEIALRGIVTALVDRGA